MKPSSPDQANPYQSPTADSEVPQPRPLPNAKEITDFRAQVHALGGLWIIVGGLAIGLGVILIVTREESVMDVLPPLLAGIINLTLGAVWFVVGVMTCLKQPWALYTGLILSYVAVIPNLLVLNVCGIGILVVVIFQAHRVIGWAKKMQANGIPLNVKP